MAAGVAVALAHLLLDSLTEGEVYLVTRRAAPARFGSDNGMANGVLLAVGFVLFPA